MATANEKRQEMAKLAAQAREYHGKAQVEAEGNELTSEVREQWTKMMSDVEKLRVEVQKLEDEERMSHVEAELRQSQGRKTSPTAPTAPNEVRAEDRKAAFRAWCLNGTSHADHSPDMVVRAASAGLNLNSNQIELRALSVGTNSLGGYTVPTTLSKEIEVALKYYGNVRNFCKVITTATGNTLDWPTVTDTANQAAVVAEAGTVSSSTDPTFGEVAFKSQKYNSDIVKISSELLQDNVVDIEALLADMLAIRIARKQEADQINGPGASGTNPVGLVTGAPITVGLAAGNAITMAKLRALEHSVDLDYRRNGAFLMHDATWSAITQIVDSTGRPLYLPGYAGLAGATEKTLFGYPVYISNQFVNYTGNEGSTAAMILFGDFKRFMVRDCQQGFFLQRLDQIYAVNNQVGFQLQQRSWCDYIGPSGCVNALSSL